MFRNEGEEIMAKKDYNKLAEEIVACIGGTENIVALKHCITRLRFTLQDENKAETEKIKKIEGVAGVVQQAGTYQIVIGSDVAHAYDAVCNIAHIKEQEDSVDTTDDNEKQKLSARFFRMLTKIFIPLLPALAGIGLIRGLLSILVTTGALTADSGTYVVLYAIAQCLFYFMPIFLGYTAGKAFGMNPVIGMMIGASMIYPDIIAVAGAEGFTFLKLPMHVENYTSTVLPILVATFVGSKLEKIVKKIIPEVIQLVFVAPIVLIITVPATLFVIGPVMNLVGGFLSAASMALYNFNPTICGFILGAIYPVVVLLGLHHGFTAVFINNLTTLGYEPLLGLLGAISWALTGTLLGFGVRTKQKKLKATAFSTGLISFLGIGEPGKFAIIVPRKRIWVGYLLSSGIGCAISAAMGAKLYAVGGSGIFQIPSALNPTGIDMGFYGYVIGCGVSLVLAFITTYLFGLTKEDIHGDEKEKMGQI